MTSVSALLLEMARVFFKLLKFCSKFHHLKRKGHFLEPLDSLCLADKINSGRNIYICLVCVSMSEIHFQKFVKLVLTQICLVLQPQT